jgi:hypothetical protein
LFGSTNCSCGYQQTSAPDDALGFELSYWESLRAYWRIYWPSQLLLALCFLVLSVVISARSNPISAVFAAPLGFAVTGLSLYLFVGRVCSRPYRGFAIVVVDIASGTIIPKLSASLRLQVAFFLWWRQLLAALLATMLAGPLNIMLSLLGLHVEQGVASLGAILVIGPILLKMLIGHEFGGLRLESRRGAAVVGAAAGNRTVRWLVCGVVACVTLTSVLLYLGTRSSKRVHTAIQTAAPIKSDDVPDLLFDIKPVSDAALPGVEIYDCTYAARGKTARFRLQFRQDGTNKSTMPIASAHGMFVAVAGSDNSALLEDLAKALEAKHLPASGARTAELPFDAVVLGENQSRGATGGYMADSPGGWKTVKIFFPAGGDDAEMFLNLNPRERKAEFRMKDPDYGDDLLKQLATVL